jgi:hypothetical protein
MHSGYGYEVPPDKELRVALDCGHSFGISWSKYITHRDVYGEDWACALCERDRIEVIAEFSDTECIICGKTGLHHHQNLRWDDTWGLVSDD